MRHIIRSLTMLAFALGVAAAAPGQAHAGPDCTLNYRQCIASSGLLSSPFQELADIECAAEYVGCIRRLLMI